MEVTSRIVTLPATKCYDGLDDIDVVAGQSFKIETSPDGEEALNMECPAGKKWTVNIQVHIYETDA